MHHAQGISKGAASMRIGMDYYPEWDDETVWEADAARMASAGVKMVRVGEFAWSRMEPEEDRFDFGWLDRAIAVMARHGIDVIIGTPTSAPPNWLMAKYPDAYLVTPNMQLRYEGVRGHRCVNSPSFRKRTVRIVTELASRYGSHPSVIGWQTDNEFEMMLCNCASCESKFRLWLKRKYGSLDAVNKAWGLVVWSGEYSSWEEVHTPRGGQLQLNPSFQLDYHRFQNESIIEYQQIQVDILRALAPRQFITHNMWESPLPIDYNGLFAPLDFASTDYYITSSPSRLPTSPYSGAYFLDRTRGLKRQNFWLMETITGGSGGGCWGPAGRSPQPGFMRAVMWQSISRGADNIVQFLWRGAVSGSEQLFSGLMHHGSKPPKHRWQEFLQLCEEVNRLSDRLEGTTVKSETALLYSHEIHRAFQIQPHIESGFLYEKLLKAYHGAVVKLGAAVDVLHVSEPLDGYKLVIAPHLFLADEGLADKLKAFAASGGTVILTNRSGIKNRNNVVWPAEVPGPLADVAGIVVEEWDPLGGDTVPVETTDGKTYFGSQWADILEPRGAETIARYRSEYYAGRAAVTVNRVGAGQVYYVGAVFGQDFLLELLGGLLDAHRIERIPGLPEGVQASIRRSGDTGFLFLVNFTTSEQTVELDRACSSVLYGGAAAKRFLLPPFGVEIVTYG